MLKGHHALCIFKRLASHSNIENYRELKKKKKSRGLDAVVAGFQLLETEVGETN